MLVRVQRCTYCRREMNAPALGFKENPFCGVCLHERMQQAAIAREPMEWDEGDANQRYAVLKPATARTPA